MGLTTEPTPHSLAIGDARMHAYCALEGLYVPAILNQTVEVVSLSPAGGRVSLRLDAEGLLWLDPETAVLSLVHPSRPLGDDVRSSYCCYVHLFPEQTSAEAWTQRIDGAFAMPVEDAAEFGRLLARRMFGDALTP